MSNLLHSYKSYESANALGDGSFNVEPGVSNFSSISTYHSPNFLQSVNMNYGADLIKSIINRIAIDSSIVTFKHMKIDKVTGNQTQVNSGLIDCFTYKANIDQTGRAFVFDLVWSLLDEGVIAIIPTETEKPLNGKTTPDPISVRVGKITQWFSDQVKVRYYNEDTGLEFEQTFFKEDVAIIESPLLGILQDSNQTLKMLKQKIKILNSEDQNAASGKINGFIQFPYMTSSEHRKKQAERRRQELEQEMTKSSYGLATLDANEKFISTGGGVQNNTLEDINKLKQDFYNQVGITENIINGTQTSAELNLYYNRVIDPIIQAIVDALNVTFISKTARTQGQIIKFFRDPFKVLPIEQLATTADLFSRNAILTPNEIREFIGKEPHPNPLADQLYNRNIADSNQVGGIGTPGQEVSENQNEMTQPMQNEDDQYIYQDEQGNLVDYMGRPVDEEGNLIEQG